MFIELSSRRLFVFSQVLASCFLSAASFDQLPKGDSDQRIEEICESNVAYLGSINSLQCNYRVSNSEGWDARVSFAIEGDRFVVDRQDVSPLVAGTNPIRVIHANDSMNYQHFNGSAALLTIDAEPSAFRYGTSTPWTRIYAWASPGGRELVWNDLRADGYLQEVFSQARWVESRVEQGQTVDVLAFPQRGTPVSCEWQVAFSRELSWLPVAWERRITSDGQLSSSLHVTRFEPVVTSGFEGPIPLAIVHRETGADGVISRRETFLRVQPGSVVINKDIGDDTFRIPHSIAEHVVYLVEHRNRAAMQRVVQ